VNREGHLAVAFPSRNRRGLERSPRPGARRAARRRPVCAAGCVPLLVPPRRHGHDQHPPWRLLRRREKGHVARM